MDKAEERYYLDLCLRLKPDLDVSEIKETEAPDFLVRSDGNAVGIEVVRFLFENREGPSPAAVDNYRNQLEKTLRDGHVARGIPPVHVSVHLAQDRVLLSRQNRDELAEHLLTFVATNLPAENSSAEFHYFNLSSQLSTLGVHAFADETVLGNALRFLHT